ncbi:uncharacterized protein DEA37_0014046 [Paragonimus westermani]|uniref:Reverse transcriptase domain-containing protein n=1 Tax=Paragonimus westermani TaxID=34504 RepID=A0A5J4NYP2_9TREM|nr:uncharacterized protein DEA37_0014046 [Paragonimus westermani]
MAVFILTEKEGDMVPPGQNTLESSSTEFFSPWTLLDHIAVSYRWRHSVEDCRAYWSSHLDSDHAAVHARFVLSFAQRTYARKCKVFNWHSSDEDVKNAYQKTLAKKLPSSSQTNDPNEHWEQIAGAMKACCEQARSEGAVHGLGVELLPGARLTDLQYADDTVLLSPSAEDMQTMLNKVSDRAGLYGMRFAHSKCKVLLQDWGISTPTFFIAGNPLETVNSFTYLGSTISSDCNIADEISARIAKARVAFSKLRHLWRREDVRLSLKGGVYNACVRSISLYGSETWPVRKQDIKRLAVFDHRCLRQLAHIKWADRVSNREVPWRVFRNVRDARSIGQVVTLHRLRWLDHVLHVPAERLP